MTYLAPAADRALAIARPLPAALIEARASVFNPLLFQDLNLTARRVIYGVLTFLNLRDVRKAVFPRRDLLRAESQLNSEATLYRGLKMLVDRGYITRTQARRSFGEFHLSPICLTAKALAMLDLGGLIHRERSLKLRDRYIKKEHTKPEQSIQNTAQPSPQVEDPQASGSGHCAEIDGKTGLPKELLRLQSLGVSKGAICWLMLQARLKGHRLGNVVETVWHRIRLLRGRAVVSYLRSMMMKGLDFAWLSRERSKEHEQIAGVSRAKAVLASLGARHHGCEVIGRDGTLYGIFDACDSGTHAVIGISGTMPVNLSFAKALIREDLRFRSTSIGFAELTD